MEFGFFIAPQTANEPVLQYQPGSNERELLKQTITDFKKKTVNLPMVIDGKSVETGELVSIHPPHEINATLGSYHKGKSTHVKMAIDAATKAKQDWITAPWEHRAAIFLKAAELLSGPYRSIINAATMLGQSKNAMQAEIDAACELIDFFRFNTRFAERIYHIQPASSKQTWNHTEWRPLEGFVFALTPFNFTSIAGNLPTAPAILGNTVVWKPSRTQIYSAAIIMEVLTKAGLPDGVINMIYTSGPETADTILSHPEFGGLHFTGSTEVFHSMWNTIGKNIKHYRSYPRIVGETGGKDFIMIHSSANPKTVVTALSRGAFEFQGQKCSAASRAYIPESMWPEVKKGLEDDIHSFKIGSPEDFSNFINAVIDEGSYNKLDSVLTKVEQDKNAQIIIGGERSKKKGYFIHPTVILAKDPHYFTMEEELFGPILTVFVYKDKDYDKTLELVDNTSIYGLTGAIFAQDRKAIYYATQKLRYAAGNFYINDKPTGAVVGQQPFGGARGSGTNDKAGSMLNLLRWLSPRSVKENFIPPEDYRYLFMGDE